MRVVLEMALVRVAEKEGRLMDLRLRKDMVRCCLTGGGDIDVQGDG